MRYGEVVHFSHPHHRLRLEHADTPFRCDGCREVGIGARFRCPFAGCDHDLHRQCALPLSPPPPPLRHPFYPRCAFVFLARAPGAPGTRYCNACGRDVAGFVYHCRACGFDLHPCCARLPHVLDAGRRGRLRRRRPRREAVPAPEGDGGVPPVRAPGAELDVPEQLQELQPPRGGGVAGGGNVYDGVTVAGSGGYRVPVIRGAAKSSHASRGGSYWGRKGKVKRCCEIAGFAAQVVISAVLGDPTALIAGVIGSLIAR
ncbi:hypothetical protein OsJ_36740 [Oryza sativa Japonica Group]|uniref:DC1 domain-containing protein n=1 Tax=Oryza sativa subsp. japonica TaxID=39947 RepID=A3CJ36_ORYSJ|nr:hypothetical protein OsJ_36740 [Oryza sativa Japonica Group]